MSNGLNGWKMPLITALSTLVMSFAGIAGWQTWDRIVHNETRIGELEGDLQERSERLAEMRARLDVLERRGCR